MRPTSASSTLCLHRAPSATSSMIHLPLLSRYSTDDAAPQLQKELQKIRNIGISAHIDSGKTTLTERILYYTGRIQKIHEVKGRDNVGAKMDSMELEREKGITIKSAATYARWGSNHINIIDTPGHVDFTIEVERSLRVLDGAILVMCGVSGVQSQTITVDRQMKRYDVPRITFINKLDRMGADPFKALRQMKEKLTHVKSAALQLPIGLEDHFQGIVDLITREAYSYEGGSGEVISKIPVPDNLKADMEAKREELLETLYEVDDLLAEVVIAEGREPTVEEIKGAIRRATISLKFTPVLIGSAYKNKGVQNLLDAVIDYLPNPTEVPNVGYDLDNNEAKVDLTPDHTKPFVGLAFKLEENPFGQLTYMRMYQGVLRKGDSIVNMITSKRTKVPRIIRMHSDEMEDIQEVGAGEICALFGIECSSGTTFTDGNTRLSMSSMFVPDPVLSLAIWPKAKGQDKHLSKALNRFQREDPTFRVHTDAESNQIIISGMGELHLEIYMERMRREYNVDLDSSPPRVAYRETLTGKGAFDFTHKKQTGGQGQYARVAGYVEAIEEEDLDEHEQKLLASGKRVLFQNQTIGGSIPPNFIPACEKGFFEAATEGPLIGHPIQGVRVTLTDGGWHPVDSSELAFKIACINAFKQGMLKANPQVLEPVMGVEITVPKEFQSTVVSSIGKRKGVILNSENMAGTDYTRVDAEVPLSNMVGYSTDLRSTTQGKGEFSMEFKKYSIVPRDSMEKLVAKYKEDKAKEKKE
jgi:elongation factor G